MFLLLFLQVNLAMISLRKKRPDLDRGFKVPLFPWLSILAILMLLFLAVYMFNYSLIAWIVTGIWIAAGLYTFKAYASKREIEHIRKVEALERIERKEYRILVCLSNPTTVESLTHLAIAMAKKHRATIIFNHIIEVREDQKLMAGLDEAARVRPMLDKAESLAEEFGIPARSVIEVSHRISLGIVETAVEESCNFILIGRQKQPNFMDRLFSSLIDTVLQKSPSEVAVLHGNFDHKQIRNILIPFGADIHTHLATEIAPALAEHFHARLKIAMVLHPDMPEAARSERIDEVKRIIAESAPSAELKILTERDIYRAIMTQARGIDLVLMGGRSGDFIELLLSKSLSQAITENVKCPVIWAREYEERGSFWASLLKPIRISGEQYGK
jgi:nucleotide-binding universal stress UspA family protein